MPSDELRERLLHLFNGDHKRGCEGRTYSCDCGYDPDVLRALKDAAAALEAAALDAQGAQWKPILTAPKMKTLLLFAVTDIGDDGSVQNWRMETGCFLTGHDAWKWGRRILESYDIQPTHWQPLPQPPQPSTGR